MDFLLLLIMIIALLAVGIWYVRGEASGRGADGGLFAVRPENQSETQSGPPPEKAGSEPGEQPTGDRAAGRASRRDAESGNVAGAADPNKPDVKAARFRRRDGAKSEKAYKRREKPRPGRT
ncbi:MAG: hypothetical protein AAF850_09490 [Pseudomonadota bacterium]